MKSFIKKTYPFIQKILIESQYVFYINLIEKLVFFIFFLILARELDKSTYGLIATVFAFCNLSGSLFDLGFGFYFQRESDSKDIKSEIESAISFRFFLLIFFALVVFVYFYSNLLINPVIISIIGLLVYLNGFNVILNSFLYGRKKYKKSFIGFLLSRLVYIVLIALFLILKVQSYMILVTLLISVVLHFFILLNLCKQEDLHINLRFNRLTLRKILKSSVPIGLGSIFVLLYDRLDILIIERIISFEAVAIYSIAYSLYRVPQLISNVILTPVYTDLSKSFAIKKSIDLHAIMIVCIMLVIISLFSVLLVNMFGEPIILFFYGNKYASSIPYLKYLVFALPGLFLNNLTGVISNSIRKEKIPMISTGITAMVNVTLNIILIPLYGIWGAVAATIISEYFVFILQSILLINFNLKQKFIAA
jgi:O-antigen/teichoic acid export membrane protein